MTVKFGMDLVYAAQATGDNGLANGYLNFNKWGTQRYPTRSTLNVQDGSGSATSCSEFLAGGQIDWNDTYYRSWPYFGSSYRTTGRSAAI